MNGKNALLINDTENVYHWGCYGTSRAIKDQLISKGVKNIESITVYEIHALSPTDVPESVEDFKDKDNFVIKFPAIAEKMDKCDTVVINGEGTVHGFRTATRALLYLIFAAKHFFNKKVILINHSCYPEKWHSHVLDFYRKCYLSCDFVAARESCSVNTIRNKLGVACVAAFDSLPLSIKNVYDQIPGPLIKQPYICVSGAVNYKYARSSILASELVKAYPNHDFIYLVGSKDEGINREEPQVYESLRRYFPNLILFDAKSFTDWLSIIKHSDLLISGRFHYTVAALCLGTRSVYYKSNTPKIDSVAADLNLPRSVIRTPSLLFRYMLWYQLRQIKDMYWPNRLEELCKLAKNNFAWI